ncbi:MAG: SDR family NAD(P)-dependent oxidoreductase [Rhodothermales bacterium]
MATNNLEGWVVVITGAAGRLGRRMVSRFAEHGATIAAVDVQADAMVLPEGARGRAFGVNVTDEAAVQVGFQQIGEAFGRVDALVHTVGAWDGRPFLDTSLDAWNRMVDLNLTSAFLCFREALRLMQGHGGRLIGIASGQGADRGRAQQGGYSAAKAGVVRLVEAVAEEMEGSGITAHAIAPSMILFEENSDQKGVAVSHIVDLALYLCSPAGDALNGATLRAYGSLR